MSYSVVPSVTTGYLWTAADHNTYIKDNFAAGVPDIFTTKGDLAIATAADAAARLAVGTNGQVLTADSDTGGGDVGIKWSTVGSTAVLRYKTNSTTTVATGATAVVIDYAAKVYDPDTAVTTGAAWHYDVPAGKTGYYLVTASAMLDSSANWGVGEQAELALFIGGVLHTYLIRRTVQAAGTFGMFLAGATMALLTAADVVDIRLTQNSGGNVIVNADGDYSHIAIARLFSS